MFTLNRPNMTFATLVASALLTTTLHAQDIDNRANVYGGITEYVFDSNWNQDNGPGWMLGGELPVGERWALTLEQYKLETDKAVGLGEADYTF